MSNETARERVAGAIQESWPGIIAAWEAGTGDLNTLENLDELDAQDMADAVIAHLWEQAERPEVVEAVQNAMEEYAQNPIRLLDGYDPSIRNRVAITATLTAIIGPRKGANQ